MGNTEAILIVDDSAPLLKKYQTCLNEYTILTAHNGEEAIGRLEEYPEIDLVLTDLEMPKMDGFDLLALLGKEYRHIPAIVISATRKPQIITQAIESGAINFVGKPVQDHTLLEVVKKGLAERKMRLDHTRRAQNNADLAVLLHALSRHHGEATVAYELSIGAGNINDLVVVVARDWQTVSELGRFRGDTKRIHSIVMEAIYNAIYYGVLGVSSSLRDHNHHHFYQAVEASLQENGSKTISLRFSACPQETKLIIDDRGQGFDWRNRPRSLKKLGEASHGRGLLMIEAWGTEIQYEEDNNGSEVAFILKA